MTRVPTLASVALAAACLVGVGFRARAGGVSGGAHPAAPVTGPRESAAVPGEVVVRDEDELRRALADAEGPRDLRLAPRVWHGDWEIRRPVALRGGPGVVLEGTGTGTVVDVQADDVTIADVVVRGSGSRHTHEDAGIKAKGARIRVERVFVDRTLFGISLQLCDACVVDSSRVQGRADVEASVRGDGIKLWEASGSIVRDSIVEDARDLVVWYSRRVHLERNVVRRSRYGTHFMYAHDGVLADGRLEGNVVGVFVMYSARLRAERTMMLGAHGAAGMGIGFKESDAVAVEDCWIVGNTTGVYLDRTPRTPAEPVSFARNVLALDDVALRLHGSERGIRVVDNDFRGNGVVAQVEGGGDALGLELSGNWFDEYAGYDLDGDGTGEVPFEQRRLSTELADAHPSIRFLDGTAALGLVDTIAHAVPLLASRKLLADARPAMRAHHGSEP